MKRGNLQRAIQLVESWLSDTSGYDKRVWPRLRRAIEKNRLSYRKRFDERGNS